MYLDTDTDTFKCIWIQIQIHFDTALNTVREASKHQSKLNCYDVIWCLTCVTSWSRYKTYIYTMYLPQVLLGQARVKWFISLGNMFSEKTPLHNIPLVCIMQHTNGQRAEYSEPETCETASGFWLYTVAVGACSTSTRTDTNSQPVELWTCGGSGVCIPPQFHYQHLLNRLSCRDVTDTVRSR